MTYSVRVCVGVSTEIQSNAWIKLYGHANIFFLFVCVVVVVVWGGRGGGGGCFVVVAVVVWLVGWLLFSFS